MDPARQNWVEERLDAIYAIARKHRAEPDELLDLHRTLKQQLDDLEHAEERSAELAEKVAAAEADFLSLAAQLSAGRKKAAKRFASAVTDTMANLGMPGGIFEIKISPRDRDAPRSWGVDNIEFLISANPGQPPMPLSRIASGGELSRMSLSIQVIASDGSAIPTMIFDEVDSGVGGGIAEMVGLKLRELGETRQVFCVTHLPQVASLADHHFRIFKISDGKSTKTAVTHLNDNERIEELARMLGGVEITTRTRDHAAEMLRSGSRDQQKKNRA
jgi:DNA repair protein RecN (Recombination protein N)